jgi:hypothetical protein
MTVRDIRDMTVLKAIRDITTYPRHQSHHRNHRDYGSSYTVRSDLDSEFSDSEHLVPFEDPSLSSIP